MAQEDIFYVSALMGSLYFSTRQSILDLIGITIVGYQTIFNINNTRVEFIPTRQMFLITDNDKNIIFEVYKNTPVSRKVKQMWEPLIAKINDFYISSLQVIAEENLFVDYPAGIEIGDFDNEGIET